MVDVWNDHQILVDSMNRVSGNERDVLHLLNQYDKNKHQHILKEFFQKCLKDNDIERMREFLVCFQGVYRLVYTYGAIEPIRITKAEAAGA